MYPKVLVVGRVAWTANQSTLSSVFKDYPADKLAYICIETQDPDFDVCANHFQISEIAMIKKLFKWSLSTGTKREPNNTTTEIKSIEHTESKIQKWVRKHRSPIFLYSREILWRAGGWKSNDMKRFIDEFKPDVVFLMSDPLPCVCRLQRYVISVTQKPAAIFLMDDIWNYNEGFSFLRLMLRREVKLLISLCKTHFSISELMKEEYDRLFGIDSIILTKGIVARNEDPDFTNHHKPIKIVYTGQLIYGRDKSLEKVVEAVTQINDKQPAQAEIHIYTQTEITPRLKQVLDRPGISYIHEPVPYEKVKQILEESDVLLFIESLEKKHKNVARLSFSTKLSDYFSCAKCIIAIGDGGVAPIKYLKENNAALVCTSNEQIVNGIKQLLKNTAMISELAKNAYNLGITKHSEQLMKKRAREAICKMVDMDDICHSN